MGTVGSGKTSLLSAILGQVPKLNGEVKVNGKTAYVAQTGKNKIKRDNLMSTN